MSVLCPRCQLNSYTPYGETWEIGDPAPPALSRTTRGEGVAPIYVCSPCGQDEAMLEFFGPGAQPPEEWPVKVEYTFPQPEEVNER